MRRPAGDGVPGERASEGAPAGGGGEDELQADPGGARRWESKLSRRRCCGVAEVWRWEKEGAFGENRFPSLYTVIPELLFLCWCSTNRRAAVDRFSVPAMVQRRHSGTRRRRREGRRADGLYRSIMASSPTEDTQIFLFICSSGTRQEGGHHFNMTPKAKGHLALCIHPSFLFISHSTENEKKVTHNSNGGRSGKDSRRHWRRGSPNNI